MNENESKKVIEKYLDTIKEIDGWVTVSEWAIAVGEKYPDLLEKANREAELQKNETTGLREIAARISFRLARGGFEPHVQIDASERPRRVRYLSIQQVKEHIEDELEEDLAPLTRDQIIRQQEMTLSVRDKYRITEMRTIISQLKSFFNLDFEFEHAKAILNREEAGNHHPDNIQLLLKSHNRMKNSNNWKRFTIDEQIEYIKAVVKVQELVSSRMGIQLEDDVIDSLIDRLKAVY